MTAATLERRLARAEAALGRRAAAVPGWATPIDLAAALGVPLHPWQRRALASTAPRLIVKGPRQSGKSTISGLLSLHTAVGTPESLTLLIAPAQRQSMELARTVRRMAATLGLGTTERTDPITPTAVSMTRIEFPNGSRVLSLPGSSEATVRGFAAPRLIVCDEASRIAPETFAAIRPSLASAPDGRLVLVSSPWVKAGVFWETWTDGSPAWERIEVTLGECPHLSAGFLAEEKRSLPPWVWLREYEGQFSDDDTTLFPAELVAAALDETLTPLFPRQEQPA
jgi:Terminase large subunit, T4likevirus-type, N-terminal